MPDPLSPEPRDNTSAGHLTVHLDPSRAADMPFLFEQQETRIGPAFLASFGSHAAVAVLAFLMVRYGGQTVSSAPVLPQSNPDNIIWLSQPGPGGGGGGGGNQMKEPPRKAELPGKDKLIVPVAKPPTVEVAKNEPNPLEQLNIPAKSLADATQSLPGALEGPPGPPTISQGSGTGGGSGTGRGTGIGPGTGSGLGPGSGGGTGGGAFQPGNGVTLPRILREVKPQYTSDAMRAKVQGTVWLQCVVTREGNVSDVQVMKSLDSTFGLDQQAVIAARQWKFAPGMRLGEPVPVLITIELTFTLR